MLFYDISNGTTYASPIYNFQKLMIYEENAKNENYKLFYMIKNYI